MRPLIDFDAPKYNLKQPLSKRIGKLAPKIGGILLATALVAQQAILEKKGPPERRNTQGGGVSLQVSNSTPIAITNTIRVVSTKAQEVVIPEIVQANPEIVEFLAAFSMQLDKNDTNQTMYEKISAIIELLQSSEYNSEASIESVRARIRERIHAGQTNTPALMQVLNILKYKQEITEELFEAFRNIEDMDDVGKMNEALSVYHNKEQDLCSYEDWKALVTRIEEEYQTFHAQESKKRKMPNQPQKQA